jgi:hypothetical protein
MERYDVTGTKSTLSGGTNRVGISSYRLHLMTEIEPMPQTLWLLYKGKGKVVPVLN